MAKLTKEIQEAIDKENENLYREQIYINGKHEYDYHKLEVSKTAIVHTLYYSDDFEWADRLKKQVAMQLVDNGDGIEVIGLCSKKHIECNEAERLHILLRLSSDHSVYQIAEPAPKKEF